MEKVREKVKYIVEIEVCERCGAKVFRKFKNERKAKEFLFRRRKKGDYCRLFKTTTVTEWVTDLT